MCVTVLPVSCNFNRVFGGQWQWYPRFWPHSKQAFSCLIAFGHPSPVVGRQVGKTNTLALSLGIPPSIFGASTEFEHLGAERPGAYPVAPVRHPPGSARVQTWDYN